MGDLKDLHPILNKYFLFLYAIVLVLAFNEFFKTFSPFVSLPYALVLHKLTFNIISSTVDRFILLICTILIYLFQKLYFKNIIKIFGLNFYNYILYLSILIFILYYLNFTMVLFFTLNTVISICFLILSSNHILSGYLLINQSQKLLSADSSSVLRNILVLILIIMIPIHFSALIYSLEKYIALSKYTGTIQKIRVNQKGLILKGGSSKKM